MCPISANVCMRALRSLQVVGWRRSENIEELLVEWSPPL